MPDVKIIHADCRDAMRELPDCSVDSMVTDAPYHLTSIVKRFGGKNAAPAQFGKDGAFARAARGFMGKSWDGGNVAFDPDTWRETIRLLKPGAYGLVFSGARTFDLTASALREAGYIMHPFIAWIFGSGFPKAKHVDAEGHEGWRYGLQALKPAIEPILMVQKPFSEKTGTANILKHGTGAINIDACRIHSEQDDARPRIDEPSMDRRYDGKGAVGFTAKPGRRYKTRRLKPGSMLEKTGGKWRPDEGPLYEGSLKAGRWPANVIHDGGEEVLAAFPNSHGQQGDVRGTEPSSITNNVYGKFNERPATLARNDSGSAARFFKQCGFSEENIQWISEHASRFHYSAKASADDRLGSAHPTVKPIDLIAYLCRLITPPGGTVLDPFAGSGTTGMACLREGFDAILIEREADYVRDIEKRLAHVRGGDTPLFAGTAS